LLTYPEADLAYY